MASTKISSAGITYPDSTTQTNRVPKLTSQDYYTMNNWLSCNIESGARRIVLTCCDMRIGTTAGWNLVPYSSGAVAWVCRASSVRYLGAGVSSSTNSNGTGSIALHAGSTGLTTAYFPLNGTIELQATSSDNTAFTIRWMLSSAGTSYGLVMGSGYIYSSNSTALTQIFLNPTTGSVTDGRLYCNTY